MDDVLFSGSGDIIRVATDDEGSTHTLKLVLGRWQLQTSGGQWTAADDTIDTIARRTTRRGSPEFRARVASLQASAARAYRGGDVPATADAIPVQEVVRAMVEDRRRRLRGLEIESELNSPVLADTARAARAA